MVENSKIFYTKIAQSTPNRKDGHRELTQTSGGSKIFYTKIAQSTPKREDSHRESTQTSGGSKIFYTKTAQSTPERKGRHRVDPDVGWIKDILHKNRSPHPNARIYTESQRRRRVGQKYSTPR